MKSSTHTQTDTHMNEHISQNRSSSSSIHLQFSSSEISCYTISLVICNNTSFYQESNEMLILLLSLSNDHSVQVSNVYLYPHVTHSHPPPTYHLYLFQLNDK
uniref:Uncharacterized protein n=1 Tax=Arion vulgaris TaxID=1028688 RepID=A0A0B6ZPY4_9EUPU